MPCQLAQVNIARMRHPLHDRRMQGIAQRVEEMNALAEQTPGFIWRLPGSEASEQALRAFEKTFVPFDPALLFYNLSVWETPQHLKNYAYKTIHIEMLRSKELWIVAIRSVHLALWWIPEGHRPSIAESAERLDALEQGGPSAFAFNFQTVFAPPVE